MTVPVEWQLATMLAALLVALLVANRGMAIGVFCMLFGAQLQSPLVVAAGALWAWLMMPDEPEGGAGGGRERHA